MDPRWHTVPCSLFEKTGKKKQAFSSWGQVEVVLLKFVANYQMTKKDCVLWTCFDGQDKLDVFKEQQCALGHLQHHPVINHLWIFSKCGKVCQSILNTNIEFTWNVSKKQRRIIAEGQGQDGQGKHKVGGDLHFLGQLWWGPSLACCNGKARSCSSVAIFNDNMTSKQLGSKKKAQKNKNEKNYGMVPPYHTSYLHTYIFQ